MSVSVFLRLRTNRNRHQRFDSPFAINLNIGQPHSEQPSPKLRVPSSCHHSPCPDREYDCNQPKANFRNDGSGRAKCHHSNPHPNAVTIRPMTWNRKSARLTGIVLQPARELPGNVILPQPQAGNPQGRKEAVGPVMCQNQPCPTRQVPTAAASPVNPIIAEQIERALARKAQVADFASTSVLYSRRCEATASALPTPGKHLSGSDRLKLIAKRMELMAALDEAALA